ncbi:MAG: hypothetical protein IT371_05900 [Deltaproteobacteria bacterium]|nr:hypothetical protein [Deltaproteobacteria bacterium]
MSRHRLGAYALVAALGVASLSRAALAQPGDTSVETRGPSGQTITITGPDWFLGDSAFVKSVVDFVHQDGVRLASADEVPASLADRHVGAYVADKGLGYYRAHGLSPVVQTISLSGTELVAGVGLSGVTVGLTLGLWDARAGQYVGANPPAATVARRSMQLGLGPESLGLLNQRLRATGGVPAARPGMRYLGPVAARGVGQLARLNGNYPKGTFVTEAQWQSFQASLRNLKAVLRR